MRMSPSFPVFSCIFIGERGGRAKEQKMTEVEKFLPFVRRHLESAVFEAASSEEQLQALSMAIDDVNSFTSCTRESDNELYCAAVVEQAIHRLRSKNAPVNPAVISESVEGAGSIHYSEKLISRILSPRALFLCRKLNAGLNITRG